MPYEESGWYDGQMWVKPPEVSCLKSYFFCYSTEQNNETQKHNICLFTLPKLSQVSIVEVICSNLKLEIYHLHNLYAYVIFLYSYMIFLTIEEMHLPSR